jgi:hypothetical protein
MDFLDLELRHDFKYRSLIVKAAVLGRAVEIARVVENEVA